MALFTSKTLKLLAQQNQNGPFVSIYMPTHQVSADNREDPIRLKNLLENAENQLIENGLRSPEARLLLKPAKDLITDTLFWQYQRKGLALFLAPEFFRSYRLPIKFEKLMVISSRFHLIPTLPLLTDDGEFYLLALSQNNVKLFQGSRYRITQLDVDDIPTSLAQALRYDVPQKQQQLHTAVTAPGGSGTKQSPMYHGQGVGKDDTNSNILRFFRQVNKGLQSFLNEKRGPLVLAGVEYLFPIYQEANTYPHLIDDGVPGNPENTEITKLHQEAWQVVSPFFKQDRQEASAQYKQLANTGQSSKDIRKILPAARFGKIEKLLVAAEHQLWGSYDPETDTVHLHDEPEVGDGDLLDYAAIQTFLHGGTVYTEDPQKMPDGALIAALFRY